VVTFTATATEAADGTPKTASTSKAVSVTVTAVADKPTLSADKDSFDIQEDAAPTVVALTAGLADDDGSETVTMAAHVSPESAGSVERLAAGNQWMIKSTANSDVDFTVTFTATATEKANGDSASTDTVVSVRVAAVADAPVLTSVTPADFSVQTGLSETLSASASLVDRDGSESLSMKCEGPGTFSNDCTSWSHDTAGQFTLTFTAVSQERNGGSADSTPLEVVATVFSPPPQPPGRDVSDAFPSIEAPAVHVQSNYGETTTPFADVVVTCPSASCTLEVTCPHCILGNSNSAKDSYETTGSAAAVTAALNALQFTQEENWDADQQVTIRAVDDASFRSASLSFVISCPALCQQGLSAYEALNNKVDTRGNGQGRRLLQDAPLYDGNIREGNIVLHPWHDDRKLWICHSTGDGEGATLKNPYNLINVGWQSLGDGHFKMDACRPKECPRGTPPAECPPKDVEACRTAFLTRPATAENGHPGHSRPDVFVGDNMAATAAYAAIVGGGVREGDLFRTTCGCQLTSGAVPRIVNYEGSLSAGDSLLVSVKCDQVEGCVLITSGSIKVSSSLTAGTRRRLLASSETRIPYGTSLVSVSVDQTQGYTPSTDFTLQVVEAPADSTDALGSKTSVKQAAAGPTSTGLGTPAIVIIAVLCTLLAAVMVGAGWYLGYAKKKNAKDAPAAWGSPKNHKVNSVSRSASFNKLQMVKVEEVELNREGSARKVAPAHSRSTSRVINVD